MESLSPLNGVSSSLLQSMKIYDIHCIRCFFFYLKFAYNTVFKRTYFDLSVYCNFLFYNKVVSGWIDAMDQETNGSQIEAVLFLPAQCTRNQMGTSTW